MCAFNLLNNTFKIEDLFYIWDIGFLTYSMINKYQKKTKFMLTCAYCICIDTV